MTHLLPVRERMDALAIGLQRAERREKEREQLSGDNGSDDNDISTFSVTGIFDASEATLEHHRQMAAMQRDANKRISQDTTRF